MQYLQETIQHIGYSKEHFVHVVFNISMPHVGKFAIQGADHFFAPFW